LKISNFLYTSPLSFTIEFLENLYRSWEQTHNPRQRPFETAV